MSSLLLMSKLGFKLVIQLCRSVATCTDPIASAASTSRHKTLMTNVFFCTQTRPPSCRGRYSSNASEERRHAGSRISPAALGSYCPKTSLATSTTSAVRTGNEKVYLRCSPAVQRPTPGNICTRLSRRFSPDSDNILQTTQNIKEAPIKTSC